MVRLEARDLGDAQQCRKRLMESFFRDVRYSFRSLVRSPGYALVVVAVLALGIGANAVVFAILNGTLLRPFPYRDAEELVFLWSAPPHQGVNAMVAAFPDFVDWKERSSSFEGMAAFNIRSAHLTSGEVPEDVAGAVVTTNFFSVLGLEPFLGRLFQDADRDKPMVVLSHDLWRRQFGEEPSIVGGKVSLSDVPHTVVGVVPPGFQHLEPFWTRDAEFWLPMPANFRLAPRTDRFLRVVARLRDGVPLATAQTEMRDIAARLGEEYPQTNRGRGMAVVPLREQMMGDVRLPLLLLWSVAGAVLLMVCGNVANLQLARSHSRQREMVLRVALGASRAPLLRLVLAESLILCAVGAGLGLFFAYAVVRVLANSGLPEIPGVEHLEVGGRVLLFTVVATLFAAVVTAVAPALRLLRSDVAPGLNPGVRSPGTGAMRQSLRRFLVAAEIALALPLLVAVGLLGRTLFLLNRIEPGFEVEQRLTFRLSLPAARYGEKEAARNFYSQLLEELSALPGIQRAAATSSLPLSGLNDQIRALIVEGDQESEARSAHYRVTSGDYFQAMSIPVVKGRGFLNTDGWGNAKVALVNEAFVAEVWPHDDPLGKRVRLAQGGSKEDWFSIVGVVGDVHHHSLNTAPTPELYVPHAEDPWRGMAVVVQTTTDSAMSIPAVHNTVWASDNLLPINDVRLMTQVFADTTASSRFQLMGIGVFSALTLLLAWIGVFGVVAYQVGARTQEFCIRMALGENQSNILNRVLVGGAILALVGTVPGLGLAYLLSRALADLLYGVSPTSWPIFLGTALGLLATTLLASYLPARRALKLQPATALNSG